MRTYLVDTSLVEVEALKPPFNRRLTLYALTAAFLVSLPQILFWSDLLALVAFLLVAALASLVILIVAIMNVRRQALSVLSMLVVYCTLSWFLYLRSYDINTAGRWLFEARTYKSQVLAQPDAVENLKHVEWDGWGFAGSDTTVYLVFNPSDALSTAARSHSPGKFHGLPCEVLRVRRLEKYWYTATYYTDTGWDFCA